MRGIATSVPGVSARIVKGTHEYTPCRVRVAVPINYPCREDDLRGAPAVFIGQRSADQSRNLQIFSSRHPMRDG